MDEKKKRKIPDLYGMLDESPRQQPKTDDSTAQNPIFPDFSKTSSEQKKSTLLTQFPPQLESYLSPNIIRRLKLTPPPRGALFNALDRLRSIQYQLSTYLPANLVQEKIQHPIPGLVKGQMAKGSLLFADVSGFTALSERLASKGLEGAEILTDIMNDYFKVMLDILSRSGGILIKFAGDATLVYFPHQKNDRQVKWCVRAALRMLRAIKAFQKVETPQGDASLRMKIGVASGDLYLGNIGSAKRMEYAIMGDTVSRTMQAEGMASAGELIGDQFTTDNLDAGFNTRELDTGFFEIELKEGQTLDDFEIRAEKRRARGPLTWQLSEEAVIEQMNAAIDQIQALSPYLPTELVERVVVHAKKRKIESEYRLTTVIFCNFSGPEKLLDLWGIKGVSRVTALLAAYFNIVQDVVDHYGGIVSRIDPYNAGTKLLILFGAPIMHGDDPIRAVNAALALNEQLDDLNLRWQRKYRRHLPDHYQEPLIKHRIGITQGRTFAGQVGSSTRHEYTVMGDDVNLSARLMSAATWGQILVSQRVIDSVSGHFYTTDLQAVTVKGKSKPIPIAQIDGKREDTLLLRINERPPLVARHEEIQKIMAIIQDESPDKPRILHAQGPAGIGKSHFSDFIAKKAIELNFVPILINAQAFQKNMERHGLVLFLRQTFKITSTEKNDVRLKKIHKKLENLNLSEAVKKNIFNILGLEFQDTSPKVESDANASRGKEKIELWEQLEETASDNLFGQENIFKKSGLFSLSFEACLDTLVKLFDALSKSENYFIYLENANWLDHFSYEIILGLVSQLPPRAFILLTNARQSIPTANRIKGTVIPLGPFKKDGVKDLMAQILLESLTETVVRQTNGIPVFIRAVAEYIQHKMHFSGDALAKMLKSSNFMQQLVMSRLEMLPEEQREVARIASVIGMTFRFGELSAISDDLGDNVTLSTNLRSLVAEGLIDLIESGVDARYTFQQTYVQKAIYQSLPYDRRREMHTALAEYLSKGIDKRRSVQKKISAFLGETETTNPISNLQRIAEHYELANDSARAAETRLKAALSAFDEGQMALAKENVNKGLLQAEKTPANQTYPTKNYLYELMADLCLMAANFIEALDHLKFLIDSDSLEEKQLSRCQLKVCLAKIGLSQITQEDCAYVKSIQDHPYQHQALIIRTLQNQKTHTDESFDLSERFATTSSEKISLPMRALFYEMTGNHEKALTYFQNAGALPNAGINAIQLGDQDLNAGDLENAQEHYQQALEWMEQSHEPEGMALAHYRLSEAAYQNGDQTLADREMKAFEKGLTSCPQEIFREGASIMHQINQLSRAKEPVNYPNWQWTGFLDRIRINLLLLSGLRIKNQ